MLNPSVFQANGGEHMRPDPPTSEKLDPPSSAEKTASLERGAIGATGVAIMVLAGAAPLTSLSSNIALSLGFGVGQSTVLVIVLIAVVLTLFATAYTALSRTVVNAGALYAYIAHGLGRTIGASGAIIATILYNVAAAAFAALGGHFLGIGLATYAGIDLPWWIYTLLILMLVAALSLRGIASLARFTSIICAAQFALFAVLVVAVLVQNPGGFSFDVLSPAALSNDGVYLSIALLVLIFTGFESAAAYGEEGKKPRQMVSRATYLVLFALTFAYAAGTWAVTAAVDDVGAAARANPDTLLGTVFVTYLGDWSGPVLYFVVTASLVGAAISMHAVATRYLFSLGRSSLLPDSLSRAYGPRNLPRVSICTQIALTMLVLAPFALTGTSVFAGLLPAVAGHNSLGIVLLMTAVCVSVIVAAARGRLNGSLWATRIAPAIAGLALAGCEVLIILNFSSVTGTEDPWINFLPLLLVAGAAYGAWKQRTLGKAADAAPSR
ncbi:APC family permease [Prauserella endophytica]|uniref:APC family permease n=1 Tax=Prauserella endophytica TaxID=1592324 RepID=UPI00130523F6|nr:APC family permease [Prauserella endophytica]